MYNGAASLGELEIYEKEPDARRGFEIKELRRHELLRHLHKNVSSVFWTPSAKHIVDLLRIIFAIACTTLTLMTITPNPTQR